MSVRGPLTADECVAILDGLGVPDRVTWRQTQAVLRSNGPGVDARVVTAVAKVRRQRAGEVPDGICARCGQRFKVPVNRPAKRFCSRDCQLNHHYVTHHDQRLAQQAIWRAAQPPPAPTSVRTIFLACDNCGAVFTIERGGGKTGRMRRCCSLACTRTLCSRRYRALRAGVLVAEVLPAAIFERDGWICQLCFVPVGRGLRWPDQEMASLDHVVPISKGGTHEPSNVQLAHLGCNSLKSARLDLAGVTFPRRRIVPA